MNLETRVETLEHELNILKNEIEETLLEIQDQVLMHYYPSLRAEDSTPPQEASKPLAARAKTSKKQADDAFKSIAHRGMAGPAGLQMREISLSDGYDFAQTEDEELDSGQPLGGKSGGKSMADEALNPSLLPKLSAWSNFAVQQIGQREAVRLVESCTEEVGCTPGMKASLLQLIALHETDEPPPKVDSVTIMNVFLKLNKLFVTATSLEKQAIR